MSQLKGSDDRVLLRVGPAATQRIADVSVRSF